MAKELKTERIEQTLYKCGKYTVRVRREFSTSGSTILEQIVTMLLDEMERREKTKYNGGCRA